MADFLSALIDHLKKFIDAIVAFYESVRNALTTEAPGTEG